MALSSLLPVLIFSLAFILLPSAVDGRPRTQRIIIHGHEWTVPNEPGWHESKPTNTSTGR